jgi:hypothetical protein
MKWVWHDDSTTGPVPIQFGIIHSLLLLTKSTWLLLCVCLSSQTSWCNRLEKHGLGTNILAFFWHCHYTGEWFLY